MAKHVDAEVQAFRNRPLDAGPYAYLWIDALVVKVREDGRTQDVSGMLPTVVNRDGQREILGVDIDTAGTGSGWLAFLRGVVARGLTGAQLPDALRGEPAGQGPPDRATGAHRVVAQQLRPAQPRAGPGPVRPGRSPAAQAVPRLSRMTSPTPRTTCGRAVSSD